MARTTPRRCPICKREAPPSATNRDFPFCSARCRQVDLGNWLGEAYAISTPADVVVDELAPPPRKRAYDEV